MKKTILFLLPDMGGGGAERVVSLLSRKFADGENKVYILTFSGKDIEDSYDISTMVKRLHLNLNNTSSSLFTTLKNLVLRFFKIRQILRTLQPTVSISFLEKANVQLIISNLGLGNRIIISERNNPKLHSINPLWELLKRIFYKYSFKLIAQTKGCAEYSKSNYTANTVIIPNPVEMKNISLKRKNKKILFVGRLSRQKGVDVLIKSFQKISSKIESWNLEILGQGEERKHLEKMVADYSLEERINFLGFKKEVYERMSRSSLVILPSRYEGFPNVLLEAMSLGVPVISSDCDFGPSDLITDGVNGFLFPVGDSNALSEKILKFISNDYYSYNFSTEGLKTAERYNVDSIFRIWNQLLDDSI